LGFAEERNFEGKYLLSYRVSLLHYNYSSFTMSVYSDSRVSLDSFAPTSRAGSRRPGTGRPTTTATSVASQDLICAVSESRGVSSTVGLAFVNLATAEAVLCQICDSQTYVNTIIKIGVFEPSEILFMNTTKESKLRYIIQENLPDPIFTFLDRRCWSEKTGHEYVDRLAFPEEVDSLKVTLGGNYFAACCFAAVGLLPSYARDLLT
jgi:DNA mismatch repair protein MSH4